MGALKNKKRGFPKDHPGALLKKILTAKEIKHIKVNYFKGGILGINVDSSVWLYQFNLKKEGLVAELGNRGIGIKDIHFYLGQVK
jgi:hypothetical protein